MSKTYWLTTDHAASSYGNPVLVDSAGAAYGPADIGPEHNMRADDVARASDLCGEIPRNVLFKKFYDAALNKLIIGLTVTPNAIAPRELGPLCTSRVIVRLTQDSEQPSQYGFKLRIGSSASRIGH